MSVMSEYDLDLQTIRSVVDPVLSAEDQVERKIDGIIRELDEICAMAANRETVDLVEGQRVGVGHLCNRAGLLARLLLANRHSQLRGAA